MTLLASFIVIALALTGLAWWRGSLERALAFAFVAGGLGVMAAIYEQAGGVVAFAIWTIVSYLLLNFPIAATLYLVSAFCYILELQGVWMFQIQVASNLAGLIGLAVIWYEHPKWRYVGFGRAGIWGRLAVDYNTTSRRQGNAQETKKEAAQ